MELSFVPIPFDMEAYVRNAIDDDSPRRAVNIVKPKSFIKMDKKLEAQIRSQVKAAGLPETFADELIGRGVKVEEIEALIAEEKRKADTPPVTPTPETTNPTPETTATRSEDIEGQVALALANRHKLNT